MDGPEGEAVELEIVRPLVFCPREAVEGYLKALGQSYRTDSTNLSDSYARNRIRHQVLPPMSQVHPGWDRSFAAMVELNREENDYLNTLAGGCSGRRDMMEKSLPGGAAGMSLHRRTG